MVVLIGVALVSTAGWLFSLAFSNSAARRHLILTTALVTCLLLPMVLKIRSESDWTLLEIPSSSNSSSMDSEETLPPLRHQPIEESVPLRNQTEDGDARLSKVVVAQENVKTIKKQEESEYYHSQLTTVDREAVSSTQSNGLSQSTLNESAATTMWVWARSCAIVVYAFVTCAMLFRIITSLIGIQRVRRRGIEIGVAHNGIRILVADVAVPLAIGFGRPAIVLPLGFREEVQPDELQDVLDHEAEHLLRGDHWILLLQGITAAAYWPIITVHLLNRELYRAREELCDNAVLARRDPAAYGLTLLAVAEQVRSRRTNAVQLAPSIIRRGELEHRVMGVLDVRRDRRTRMGQSVRWTVATSFLGLAILAGTTRVVAVTNQTVTKLKVAEPKVVESLLPNANISWTGRPLVDSENPTLHRGVVLGPDGKPLVGAAIYAASTIELLELANAAKASAAELGPVRAMTDTQGRFEFHADDLTWVTSGGDRKRWETLLVATKMGVTPGWLKTWGEDRSVRSHWYPHPNREVVLRTRPPETLTGQFLLEGGTPLAGALVRLTGLMAPLEYDLDVHIPKEEDELALFQGVNYAEALSRPAVLPGLKTEATTDEDGRFKLPGLPKGFIAQIEVTHPQAVTTSLRVAVRSMKPVYRKPFLEKGKPTLTLYGSGFTAELPRGAVLRGQVTSGWGANQKAAAGVIVALANHNARSGLSGQRFLTDVDGRFEVTGLPNDPQGYELAFTGSFAAPYADFRQRVAPGGDARVNLAPAVPYRLKLVDPKGNPVDRDVYSIEVQPIPGVSHTGIKERFNDAKRVAPGIYEGIVPTGPASVLVKRGEKTDRPAAVNPKAFFAPGRRDWTLEEERYAYGDDWRIAQPAIVTTERLGVWKNRPIDQLELAAVEFTNARENDGVLELTATVYSDPPVEVTLVDTTGNRVKGAQVKRQLKQYNGQDLPATFSVYGLHPDRAEFLVFTLPERGLIGTLSTRWTSGPLRVVMQPAATLIGRITDETGQPDFDFGIRMSGQGLPPDTFVAGRMNMTTDEPGKRKGEFSLVVLPDVEVRGEFVRMTNQHATRPTIGTAFAPVIPQPGETVDLGDLIMP
ncbi:M56 family metallopeptidase [Gimesia fumaroli]|uniref:BlaR1 peptidase M56 n=1 Tax=Gimesia fumaroli TaxID=2527976 RepID=A0A518IF98_9PLAN|nr:M56 family metallopeptidase [Gimesia fumaroli]QDV51764.1 BlaR1 peptidase M56 [Gimesia fumaroli]